MTPTATTRRNFLAATGAVLAGATLAPRAFAQAAAPQKRRIPIGVQLYSVRNELKTDFDGVIEQVGKMGFEGVEFASRQEWSKKPAELRKLLDDNNLKCCGTHTPLITLQGDAFKATVDLHKTLGNRYLIVPSLQGKTAQAWENLARQINEIAAKAKEHDMLVGFHAHAGEFKKYEGSDKTAWEIFFDNTTPDVIHQVDIGNTLGGGGDPVAMIRKYPGRTKSLHMKEHGGAKDAAIGEGKVDWKTLIEACQTVGGTEWYVVEHETGTTPLVSIKTCLDNLKKMTA